MKRITFTTLALALAGMAFAQVQIDKPIQLTGGSGQRSITNLEAPVNGTDAVNKDYVDAAVAASGGGFDKPIGISSVSGSTMNRKAAMVYCKNLTEGGNTDWRLPSLDELVWALSDPSITVPSESSTVNLHYRNPYDYIGGMYSTGTPSYTTVLQYYKQSDGTFEPGAAGSNSNINVRCVRY